MGAGASNIGVGVTAEPFDHGTGFFQLLHRRLQDGVLLVSEDVDEKIIIPEFGFAGPRFDFAQVEAPCAEWLKGVDERPRLVFDGKDKGGFFQEIRSRNVRAHFFR